MKYENILFKMCLKAIKKDEIPVAALIEKNGKIISKCINKRNKTHNPLAHAEINCIIKAAKKLKDWRLNECTLYVTLEPCHMCKEIIKETRIKCVYYYNENYKQINYQSTFKKINTVNNDFSILLTNFFKEKRNKF